MTLSTGDLVRYVPNATPCQEVGLIVAVMDANGLAPRVFDSRGIDVYYVFLPKQGIVGPLFNSEIRRC